MAAAPAGVADPLEIRDDETLDQYVVRMNIEEMERNGFRCYQGLQGIFQTAAAPGREPQETILGKLFMKGGQALLQMPVQIGPGMGELRLETPTDNSKRYLELMHAAIRDLGEVQAAAAPAFAAAEGASPQNIAAPTCAYIVKQLSDQLAQAINILNNIAIEAQAAATAKGRSVTNSAFTGARSRVLNQLDRLAPILQLKYPSPRGKFIFPLKYRTARDARVMINAYLEKLESNAESWAKARKRDAASGRKESGLKPEQRNRNKLCVASVPYAALQRLAIAAPDILKNAATWRSEAAAEINLDAIQDRIVPDAPAAAAAAAPGAPKRDYLNSPKTFASLMVRVLCTWTGKYVGAASSQSNNYAISMPGYSQFISPTMKAFNKEKMFSQTKFSGFLTQRPGLTATATPTKEGGNYIQDLIAKGVDVETQVLLSAMYSMPASVYVTENGGTMISARKPLPRYYNNATLKPRFRWPAQQPGMVPDCATVARLLDMGGDSCPSATPALLGSVQNYTVAVDDDLAQSEVKLQFANKKVKVDIGLGRPRRMPNNPQPWRDAQDAYALIDVPYELHDQDLPLETVDSSKFARSGASAAMGSAVAEGLGKGWHRFLQKPLPPTAGSVDRYRAYLQSGTWVGSVVEAALYKWIGDYARLMETFSKFTMKKGGTMTPVTTSAVLSNNDRPAQAASILMVNAVKHDELTPSASVYASDPNNTKATYATALQQAGDDSAKRNKIMGKNTQAIWTVAPDAIGPGKPFNGGVALTTARGTPRGNNMVLPGSALAMCLLSSADTIHDMTPGDKTLGNMASALTPLTAGGGGRSKKRPSRGKKRLQRRRQRGGAKDPDVSSQEELMARYNALEVVAAEAMMAVADGLLTSLATGPGAEDFYYITDPGAPGAPGTLQAPGFQATLACVSDVEAALAIANAPEDEDADDPAAMARAMAAAKQRADSTFVHVITCQRVQENVPAGKGVPARDYYVVLERTMMQFKDLAETPPYKEQIDKFGVVTFSVAEPGEFDELKKLVAGIEDIVTERMRSNFDIEQPDDRDEAAMKDWTTRRQAFTNAVAIVTKTAFSNGAWTASLKEYLNAVVEYAQRELTSKHDPDGVARLQEMWNRTQAKHMVPLLFAAEQEGVKPDPGGPMQLEGMGEAGAAAPPPPGGFTRAGSGAPPDDPTSAATRQYIAKREAAEREAARRAAAEAGADTGGPMEVESRAGEAAMPPATPAGRRPPTHTASGGPGAAAPQAAAPPPPDNPAGSESPPHMASGPAAAASPPYQGSGSEGSVSPEHPSGSGDEEAAGSESQPGPALDIRRARRAGPAASHAPARTPSREKRPAESMDDPAESKSKKSKTSVVDPVKGGARRRRTRRKRHNSRKHHARTHRRSRRNSSRHKRRPTHTNRRPRNKKIVPRGKRAARKRYTRKILRK